MNRRTLSLFIGLIAAIFFVVWLHNFLIIDICLDSGGSFNKESKVCTSGTTYEEQYIVVGWQGILMYLFLGIFVEALTSLGFLKLTKALVKQSGKT